MSEVFMSERMRNVMVGIFMLGCLTLMGLMMVWFGSSPYLFSPRYTVLFYFDASAGIGANTSISMNGQRIGNIEKVDFRNKNNPSEGLVMTAKIDSEFNIPAYAQPTILTPLFAGKSTIGINANEEMLAAAPPDKKGYLPKDGTATLEGKLSQGILDSIPSLVVKIEAASDQFTSLGKELGKVASNLDEMTMPRSLSSVDSPTASGPGDKDALGNLSTVVQRFDLTLKYINLVISKESVRQDLELTLANAKKASEELKEAVAKFNTVGDKAVVLADNINSGVTDARKDISTVTTRVVGVLDSGNKLVDELKTAADEMNSTNGTIGRMLRDPRLYEGLVITVDRLKTLIGELELRAKEWKDAIPIHLK